MKFGLLTAILEGDCWPNTVGAKRRYAGVCHIDA